MNTHDIETVDVEDTRIDPIYARQKEDVAKMRASLLACSGDNLSSPSTKQALKNITAMRIYHQIARIIKYLDMMDRIEDKLYKSIDASLERMNEESPATWMQLLKIQESLQKQMIDSHKLLQPYMDLQDIAVMDLIPEQDVVETNTAAQLLPAESREKLRNAANDVLKSLQEGDNNE